MATEFRSRSDGRAHQAYAASGKSLHSFLRLYLLFPYRLSLGFWVSEWRSKAGVGAFPHPSQTQGVPSREALQLYLASSSDGSFPSLVVDLESTPEPEPEPEPEPTPVPSPPAAIDIPDPETIEEPSVPSPEVKTKEDDALMDSDAEGEQVDADKSEAEDDNPPALSAHSSPPTSRGPSLISLVVPVPMTALIDTPADSASRPYAEDADVDEDIEMQPTIPLPLLPHINSRSKCTKLVEMEFTESADMYEICNIGHARKNRKFRNCLENFLEDEIHFYRSPDNSTEANNVTAHRHLVNFIR
ncbi:hypothetical protein FRC12_002330 [Ceratobasidium sp. 428]|nr:hypothetical protein FRC12_002330 [Ceratobasidium sp. 428]